MPLSAYVFYLESKYEHEIIRDVYMMDMLRFGAFGMVEERNRPPRYWDMAKPKRERHTEAKVQDYDEQDVVDMFRGGGKL